MKVVFIEEVEGTAIVGEVKDVKNGFARNFLLPRGLALPATKHNMQRVDKLAKADVVRQEKLDGGAKLVAEKIDGVTITLRARVGQQGRLFGSITALDIAKELSETAGAEVEHRQVQLSQAIRTLGSQAIKIRLTRNVFADVTVNVESEDGGELSIAEAVEAVDAEDAEATEAGNESESGGSESVGSEANATEAASEGETASTAETAKSD